MLVPVFLALEGRATLTLLKSIRNFLTTEIISKCPYTTVTKFGSALTGKDATAGAAQLRGLYHALVSGLFYYAYNEVSFRALGKVHPITHAIANTAKRIFIIISSVLVFGNKITPTGIFGSSLTVAGVFLYSVCQHVYKAKKPAATSSPPTTAPVIKAA
jgi:solute carrier family 35 protein E1